MSPAWRSSSLTPGFAIYKTLALSDDLIAVAEVYRLGLFSITVSLIVLILHGGRLKLHQLQLQLLLLDGQVDEHLVHTTRQHAGLVNLGHGHQNHHSHHEQDQVHRNSHTRRCTEQ